MKKRDELQEEYRFMKEVIKEKPVNIRGFLLRCAGLLAGAVVFGLVAALVFVHFFSVFQEQIRGESRVVFEEDNPMDTLPDDQKIEDLTSLDVSEDNLSDVESGNSSQEYHSVDSYQKMYEEINAIAQSTMECMVTVSGISNDEDWFYVATESIEHASGVIIAEDPHEFYILTKYHAVDGVDRVMVTFYDGSIADGRYQLHDTNTNLTVLKVAKADLPDGNAANMKVAVLGNSYQVQQGESVIAIGSPMGYSNSVVHGQVTSTTSIVSAYDVQYNLFITNILGSNDGSGVLINLSGEVIGVITQEFAKENQGNVITCLPISQLKSMITALSNHEDIPYLGVKGQNVTAEITKQTGMPKGIYVSEVRGDSPALHAGIQKADILTKMNGKAMESMYQYSEMLSKAKQGDTIDVTVMRKGAEGYVEFHFEVTLGSR